MFQSNYLLFKNSPARIVLDGRSEIDNDVYGIGFKIILKTKFRISILGSRYAMDSLISAIVY